MSNTNIIQLYNNDEKTYPICHKNGILNSDGMNAVEQVEKKITQNINDLNNEINEKYKEDINDVKEENDLTSINININKNKVDAMIKVGEGITHEFINDDEKGFIKDIPKGARLASIKKIGGRSLVWNQLVDPLDTTSAEKSNINKNGCTWLTYKDKVTCKGTLNTDIGYSSWYIIVENRNKGRIIEKHKYFINKCINGGIQGVICNYSSNRYVCYILSASSPKMYFAVIGKNGDVIPLTIFYPSLIDFTRMFGFGNEPTSEKEALIMLKENFYSPCSPKLFSQKLISIIKRGYNIFDKSKSTRNTLYSDNTSGVILTATYGEGFRYVLEKYTTYTISKMNTSINIIILSNKDCVFKSSDFITINYGDNTNKPITFTTTNKYYVLYTIIRNKNDDDNLSLDEILDSVRICRGDSTENSDIYEESTIDIPESILNLDGYGWGINDSLYNEVDFENKKYIQRVGKLKITDSSVIKKNNTSDTSFLYFTRIQSNATYRNDVLCNILPTIGKTESYTENKQMCAINSSTPEGGIIYFNLQDLITENTVTNAKQYLIDNNCEVLYPLEVPIVTDISDLIPEGFLESLEVDPGGSFVLKYDNSEVNINIPTPISIEYLTELTTE